MNTRNLSQFGTRLTHSMSKRGVSDQAVANRLKGAGFNTTAKMVAAWRGIDADTRGGIGRRIVLPSEILLIADFLGTNWIWLMAGPSQYAQLNKDLADWRISSTVEIELNAAVSRLGKTDQAFKESLIGLIDAYLDKTS